MSSQRATARRVRVEFLALIALAWPILITQLSHTAMGFVDTLMAGRVGARDLAAVALGNSVWIPVFLLMNGVLMATTPKVAHLVGAGRLGATGPLVRQALWLALALGALAAAVLASAQPLLEVMRIDPELIAPTMGYLQAVAFGFPAAALFQVLRSFCDGLGQPRPYMVLGLLGLLLNIPANHVFIHGGWFGLPALGGVGCGWATALVMWFMLAGLALWIALAPRYRRCAPFARIERPAPATLGALLTLGVPIGIAVFAEASIFAVIALLIGGLGPVVVAGHQVALNFSTLIFMVPLSLSMATTVRVGQALGRGSIREARFSTRVALGTALTLACCSAVLILLGRDWVARLYTPDPAVIAVATQLIVYAALYQLSDAVQVTAAGALRGYQNTRTPMVITLIAYWAIGLPIGYSLALTDLFGPARGPAGLWLGLLAGLTAAAVMLGITLVATARRRQQLVPALQ
ncbi:MATE family efflux transporter [Marichromatium gracile]|uniref:Multidrug-efflux transporter n=1 Tax=Marichromatium gracile TaxID=1048 RepID=A0ABR5VED2_MARGR|nr:MATE family efflux transporter [Marichromatium gracile]KXX63402.1 MATE family efflux transporter [Marichromatium gracile]